MKRILRPKVINCGYYNRESPAWQTGLTGRGCNSGEIGEKRRVVFTGIEGNELCCISVFPQQEHV
jgi:hypothetical protein